MLECAKNLGLHETFQEKIGTSLKRLYLGKTVNCYKSVLRKHLLKLKSSSVTNILVYFQYIIMMFSTLNFFELSFKLKVMFYDRKN